MKLLISKIHYKKKLSIYEKLIFYVLKFLSIFYAFVVEIRNKLYDKKIFRSYSSKAFVISIGNITTGGVGKTPFTVEVAKYFLALNKKVGIISRGYGAKLSNKEPNLISDGSGALLKADLAGDEPVWISDNCRGAYVVTCRSRIKAERFLMEKFHPDVIILDDAFQHRKIKRDLDIVLVDAKNKFGNANVLPAGPLRESLNSISRADKMVVVNKGFEIEKALKFFFFLKNRYKKEIYLCKIVPDSIYNILDGSKLPEGNNIMAFSAIGQPSGFYEFLKQDYKLIAVLEFEDHHNYDKSDISKIIEFAQEENIENIVTTEKDAVKIIDIIKDVDMPVKFYALRLNALVDIKEIIGE